MEKPGVNIGENMDKYDERRAIMVDQEEYMLGYMPEDAFVNRIKNYISTIGGDNWINSRIHELNLERKVRKKMTEGEGLIQEKIIRFDFSQEAMDEFPETVEVTTDRYHKTFYRTRSAFALMSEDPPFIMFKYEDITEQLCREEKEEQQRGSEEYGNNNGN